MPRLGLAARIVPLHAATICMTLMTSDLASIRYKANYKGMHSTTLLGCSYLIAASFHTELCLIPMRTSVTQRTFNRQNLEIMSTLPSASFSSCLCTAYSFQGTSPKCGVLGGNLEQLPRARQLHLLKICPHVTKRFVVKSPDLDVIVLDDCDCIDGSCNVKYARLSRGFGYLKGSS